MTTRSDRFFARIRWFGLFWLLAAPAAAQPAEAPPGVQIITAEEIAHAGVARLSDLFLLLDD